eukprot:403371224
MFRTFKTTIGAIMTILISVCVISYVCFKLEVLFNKSDNKTTRLIINEAQYDNPAMVNVYDMGFDIAFGGYFDIQDSFGSITATHVTKVRVKNESSGIIDEQFSFKDLDLIKCGYENFNYERKNESAYQDVVSLMCIENKDDLVLGGAWTTNRFERIDVDFQLRFVNQYFDFEDMNAPIKKFIEDRYFVPVQTWQQKGMNIFVKKGSTKLQDSYMPFIPQNDIQYASVINVKPYTSQVDYFDLLSDFGGIYSALFAIGTIVVGVFRENLFYKEIIKNLYQARPPRQRKIAMKKKFKLTDYSARVDVKTQEDIFQVKSQKSLIQRIIDEVLNRVSFKFSLADLIKTTLYKLRPGDLGLVKHLDSHRNIYLFKKGVKKINNEFDALSMLKLMKQVKLLTTTLLNPSQRLMLGFQKKNVLDSDSSNQNSEEDDVRLVKNLKNKKRPGHLHQSKENFENA